MSWWVHYALQLHEIWIGLILDLVWDIVLNDLKFVLKDSINRNNKPLECVPDHHQLW